jgi:DNA-binding NarL/FixJ family response regulator
MKVLVADDHAFARRGLKLFVSETPGVTSVGEAATGLETLKRLRQDGPWAVLVLDINMPDRSGLDILKHVLSGSPGTRVLVLSGFPEEHYALKMLRAGAHGYVPKNSSADEIRAALQTVMSGRRHISPELAQRLVAELQAGDSVPPPPHKTFSEREFQVFCKVAMGRPIPYIARELCMSNKSVSTYRSRILRKLSLQTSADLMSYAMKHGLVQ